MADQPAIQPHSGNRFGACFAATTPPNNDWLITPQTNVLSSGANVKFWVKSYTADYGLERYAVWVSTTTTDISAFTKISEGNYLTAPATWEEKLLIYQIMQVSKFILGYNVFQVMLLSL